MDETGEGSRIIRLATGAEPADRDFELTWRGTAAATPAVGLFKETVDGEDYVLAFITPPTGATDITGVGEETGRTAAKPHREIIFVIDTSGSMGGTSIEQARNGLSFGLKRLSPGDRFNIIRFSSGYAPLFPDSVAATPDNLAQAMSFVRALEAGGGTDMLPPLALALTDRGAAGSDFLRQVVFLTDGAIGNEAQMFENHLGAPGAIKGVHGGDRVGPK